jgi:hypothetical protein
MATFWRRNQLAPIAHRAPPDSEWATMSSQVHAGGSCSVELFRPLRVTTTTCVAGVHYGLNTTEEVLPDGSRNMRRSMWLAHRKCSGVFRCCNVHVMCVLPDSGWSDHKDPPEFARNGTCSCNKVDLSDTRHLRSREHSCDLVDERSGHGTCIFNQTYGCSVGSTELQRQISRREWCLSSARNSRLRRSERDGALHDSLPLAAPSATEAAAKGGHVHRSEPVLARTFRRRLS